MKHQSQRFILNHHYKNIFPVTSGIQSFKDDYPIFFRRSLLLRSAVKNYFFLNRGWYRTKNLYSHVNVHFVQSKWILNVYFVQRKHRSKFNQIKRVLTKIQDISKRRRSEWRLWLLKKRKSYRAQKQLKPLSTTMSIRKKHQRQQRWLKLLFTIKNKRRFALQEQAKFWAFERLSEFGGANIQWIWNKVKLRTSSTETIIAQMRFKLVGRFSRSIKSIAYPLISMSKKLVSNRGQKIKGVHVRCAGRFTRQQRASQKTYQYGRLNRSDMANHLEQSFLTVPLKFGAVGISLTIAY